MNEWDRLHRMSIRLKAQYPKGTVVELHNMEGESRMPAGLRGRVIAVDDHDSPEVREEKVSLADAYIQDFKELLFR